MNSIKQSAPQHSQQETAPLQTLLLFAAYALSGLSALIYQVAWQRILAIHSGVGIYSIALIVSAFMAGLGIGSLLGAKTSYTSRMGGCLLLFVLCEVLIGCWGLISCEVYYRWIGNLSPWLFQSVWISGIAHFAALVLPTTWMGMSLPYLSQYVSSKSNQSARMVGWLYTANIAGAALGAIATPWIFIRFLGIPNTIQIAAVANLVAGGIAFLLWRNEANRSSIPQRRRPKPPYQETCTTTTQSSEVSLSLWLGLYGISGVFSLAFEVLWFRVVEVSVRATAFTFGTVLSIYLVGLGLGCLLGERLSSRIQSPLRAFLLCQSLLVLYSGLAIWLLIWLPRDLPVYSDLFAYWNSTVVLGLTEESDPYRVLLLYVLLPLFLYGPPTMLMGMAFSFLQLGVQRDPKSVGRRVGFLQGANIFGNVLGSLIVGLLLIHWLGTPTAIFSMLIAGLIFPIVSIRCCGDRRQWAFVLAIGGLACIWPSNERFWSTLHGLNNATGYFAEDASGLMAITPSHEKENEFRVSMNGKLQSWIPYGGAHTELGVLAAITHPDPKDAAIVGLGSGDTAWAAGCRSEIQDIQVFEICAAEKRLLRKLASKFPDVHQLMNDRRFSILAEDGRKALALNPRKYDLIEADALPPQCAYAGNIYSLEFFQLCSSRLKPGGLMCQWAPTLRIMRTFSAVFPHVIVAPTNSIVIGSNDPIDLDLDVLRERLNKNDVSAYLGPKNLKDIELRLPELQHLVLPEELFHSVNSDLFPMDEFKAP
jgi:predicted membrane-bound spermidine synthase